MATSATVVDSSGWLEFVADGPLAGKFAPHLETLNEVVTPSVVVYEVYQWIQRERSEQEALIVVAQLEKTRIVPLTTTVALTAADLSLEHGLAMADSIVYATALLNNAELVTSDKDFVTLPGVVYFGK